MSLARATTTIVLLSLLAAITSTAESFQVSTTAHIDGIVRDAENHEPLLEAQIQLLPIRAQTTAGSAPGLSQRLVGRPPAIPAPIQGISGKDGKFAFNGLDPGMYRIFAEKDGFLRQGYGPGRPRDIESAIVSVAAGDRRGPLVIYLTRPGVVTGRISDPLGQPLFGMAVQLLRKGYDALGRETIFVEGTGVTDDQGRYRLIDIVPGDYYIRTDPAGRILMTSPGVITRQTRTALPPGLAPTYFSQSGSDSRSLVKIRPGPTSSSYDISVRPSPTYRIEGRLSTPVTGQAPPSGNIRLYPYDEADSPPSQGRYSVNASTEGRFALDAIPPGKYLLAGYVNESSGSPRAQRGPSTLLGFTLNALDVANDVLNLNVTGKSGADLTVRITLDDRPLPATPEFQTIRVRLISPIRASEQIAPNPVFQSAEGRMTVGPLFSEVDYGLYAGPLPPTVYIRDIRMDGGVWRDGKVRISGLNPVLHLSLRTGAAQINGTIGRNEGLDGAQVVLIPKGSRAPHLYSTAGMDALGNFTLPGVAPGEYLIFAWRDMLPFSYFSEELVRQCAQQGSALNVAPSANLSIQLKSASVRECAP